MGEMSGRTEGALSRGLAAICNPAKELHGQRQLGAMALCDQRVAGRRDDVFEEDRFTKIGRPAAHRLIFPQARSTRAAGSLTACVPLLCVRS
ncbi:hypothetical protein MESS4_110017 [Mesorhizobium sp. STM 4661]|nr:hypothetical protein MESS4_110017 [Mesorhizobium sp. STM 4661]